MRKILQFKFPLRNPIKFPSCNPIGKKINSVLRQNIQEEILQFILGYESLQNFSIFIEKNLQKDIEDNSVYILLQYIWLRIQFLNIAHEYAEAKKPYTIHPSIWNSLVRIIVFLKTNFALVPFPNSESLKDSTFFCTQKKNFQIDLRYLNRFTRIPSCVPFFPFVNEEMWNKYNIAFANDSLLTYKINDVKYRKEKPQELGKNFLIQDVLLKAEHCLYGLMKPILIKYSSKTKDRYILHCSGVDKISDKKWQYYKNKYCKGIVYNMTLFTFSINVRQNNVSLHYEGGECMARGYGYQIIVKDWEMDLIENFYSAC